MQLWNTENVLSQGSQYQVVPTHSGEKSTSGFPNLPDLIATYITSRTEIAGPILEFLERHHANRPSPISGLRAGIVHLNRANYTDFPLVQWQEGLETEVMALFVVAEDGCCNSLLHYGEGITWQQDGKRWRREWLEWNVFDLTQLKSLFAAVKKLLGMQHWAYTEAIRRSYNRNSEKEYLHLVCF